MVVLVCTFISLVYWCVSSIGRANQRSFVHRYLRISVALGTSHDDLEGLNKFVHSCLRPDGVFLLRMIEKNAGDMVTSDIVYQLWMKFLQVAVRSPDYKITK